MKNLLYLLFAVIFIFSSCGKPTESVTTEKSTTDEIETNVVHTDEITMQGEIEKTQTNNSPLLSTNPEAKETSSSHSTKLSEGIQNSSPIILYFTLPDLKEIKQAYDSMNPDDFMTYMEYDKKELFMTGFWDYESSGKLIDKLSSTTIPLIDGNPDDFSEYSYFSESNSVDSLIFFDESKRFIVTAEDAESNTLKELKSDSELNIISEKDLKTDTYSATIYEVTDDYYSYLAEVETNGSYIVLRSMGIDSLEDFEECFNRLKFIEIGDLIEQTELTETQTETIE